MGLLQKIKSALGFDGARAPDAGTPSTEDVDVTVEREPSSESEDAVKGTDTASAGTETVEEPDDVGVEPDDTTADEADEAGETDDDAEDEPTDETAEAADTDESDAPVTDINGIGPAYGERLSDAGVETVGDLAAADPDELAEATDIAAGRIEGWIDAAAEY